MANIRDKKAKTFGRISSFRTFLDDYPQLKEINSWKSINSSNDQFEFIIDLFSALGSIDQLQNAISRILLDKLDVIELKVKEGLKASLKSNICCNINPSLFAETVDLDVSEFDLLNIFQINPESEAGRSSYFDCNTGIKSKDMNVFLYSVIVKKLIEKWFQYDTDQYTKHLTKEKIGEFTFSEKKEYDGRTHENVLTVSVSQANYNNLNDWTSDYIDSVKLFDKQTFVTQLMGKIFGAYGGRGLSPEQIVLQKQIETIIDRLSSCASTTETDDSFFTFDNTSYSLMLEKAEIEKVGNLEYDRTTGTAVRITLEDITKAFEGLEQKASFEEQKQTFDNGLNAIMDQVSVGNPDVSEADKQQFKKNILKRLLNELSLSFGMMLTSPKIYLVILVNMRLMGITTNYDAVTFIRENLNLVNDVVGIIKDAIIKELMSEIKIMANRLIKGIVKELINDNKIKFRKTLNGLLPFGRRVNLI